MLNKGYCLNIFYTIQGKGQAQGLRVRFPTFPYLLTTKQNKHETEKSIQRDNELIRKAVNLHGNSRLVRIMY
jgi:hypothetical protein